jgi:glycogen synthase
MHVAYACRDLATDSATGQGAQTFSTAAAMARAGHQVDLVSAELAEVWQERLAGIERLTWQPLFDQRHGHVYFTEGLSYADRVYDTMGALHARAPLDVIELPDAGGEALTLLRAKRLLAQFPQTRLVVSLLPGSTVRLGPQSHQPATFGASLVAYAEEYARTHADLVLAVGATDACVAAIGGHRLRRYLPSLVDLDASVDHPAQEGLPAHTVLWLGPIRPDAGLETLLRAVQLADAREPGLRVVLRGADTPTDPVGRSYWDHLRRQLPEPLRHSVTFACPLRVPELGSLPPAGTQCVLASRACGTPGEALLAIAAGFVITAPDDSIGAELLLANNTGRVVPDGDPQTLADALVENARRPADGKRRAVAASQRVRRRYAAQRVAECRAKAYGWPLRPAPTGRDVLGKAAASVVIPVYNQGRFLGAAVDSIRRSGLEDPDIVVVDDGSTDPDTVATLERISGVTMLRREHRGLSAARNAGIERARAGFVLVLDADDLVAPDFLPAAVEALNRQDDIGFVGGYVRYFGLLNLIYVPAGPVDDLNLVLHTFLKSMVLYRREALERVGGYDENLPAFEDWELQVRLAEHGYSADVLPLVGQLYRRHSESMSFSISNGMRNELVQYIVRKHANTLSKPQLITLLQIMVDLWKTGFEPSKSVLLQQAQNRDRSSGRDSTL